jgi:hypothetical protein
MLAVSVFLWVVVGVALVDRVLTDRRVSADVERRFQ